jgi:hypothetical protein
MRHPSWRERLTGPLALCCAIAVFIAAAFDLEAESSPAPATIVRAAK